MAASDPSSPVTVSTEARVSLFVGALGFVLVGFNTTATNLAFDDIAASFPFVPETTVGFVSSGYLVGTAAFMPLAGRVADRVGRRRIFLIGVAVFAVSAVLSAIAPTVWVLIGARVLQAIGSALVIPSSLSMALPLFPENRRPSAVATWAAAGPISAGIAPSVSAAVLQWSDWRVLYFVSAPAAVLILLVALRSTREVSVPTGGSRLDWIGTVAGTTAIALIVFVVGKGGDWGWTSGLTIGLSVWAVMCLMLFVVQSLWHEEPLIDLRLFRVREVWLANVANALISVTSLSIWLVWPLYLARVWGYNNLQVGLALTAGPVAAGTMTLVGGRIADRIGHRVPIQVGSLIMVFAVAWCLWGLDADGRFLTSFLPGIASFGFGWGLSSPTMNSFALEAVAEPSWGAMNAAFNMLRNVAGAIGVAGAIALLGSPDRPDLLDAFDRAYLFFLVCTAAGAALLVVAWPGRVAASHEPTQE